MDTKIAGKWCQYCQADVLAQVAMTPMFLFVVLIFQITFPQDAFSQKNNIEKYVNTPTLNVRSSCSTDAGILHKLKYQAKVIVNEFKNDWSLITFKNGEEGCVYDKYLSSCLVNDPDISESYEGDCKDGFASGEGVARGRDRYSGPFVNGNPHGAGKYIWGDDTEWAEDVYSGDFQHGERTGFGSYTVPNKPSTVGLFYRGKNFLDCKTRQSCEEIQGAVSVKHLYCKIQAEKLNDQVDDIKTLSLAELHEKYPNEDIKEMQSLKLILPIASILGNVEDMLYANCMSTN